MSLKAKIRELTETFARGVIDAVRIASLEDILSEPPRRPFAPALRSGPGQSASPPRARRRGGRAAHRSPAQVAKLIEAIVSELGQNKDGLRSEDLQKKLSLKKKDVVRALTEALATNRIRKTGEKRATRYFTR